MDEAIIEKEALQLPEAQRALLADRLIASISRTSKELREAWVREADGRMNAFREGKLEAMDGPQAMAEIRARLDR